MLLDSSHESHLPDPVAARSIPAPLGTSSLMPALPFMKEREIYHIPPSSVPIADPNDPTSEAAEVIDYSLSFRNAQ